MKEIEALTDYSQFPNHSAENIEITYTDSAKIKLKIFAPILNNYEKTEDSSYTECPEGIEVHIYDKLGEVKTKITANYAIKHENIYIWEAKDDVVVVNKKGEQLNTEHLIWDQEKEIIYTDKYVRITTDNETLHGNGMTAKQDFTNWKIKDPHGIISLDE